MSIFNPDVPNPNNNTPRWGGDSKPITQINADMSKGLMLSGIGDSISDTVKAVDQSFKAVIDEDVWNRVNSEREQYTKDLEAANAAANPNALEPGTAERQVRGSRAEGVPTNIDKTLSYLDSIKQGMEQGKVNDTYYKSRLTAIAKDLRATYPGYREYIDKKVSGITGFDPANSLVSDLLADINTLSSGKGDLGKQATTSVLNQYKEIANNPDVAPAVREQAAREYGMVLNGQMTPERAMLSMATLQKDRFEIADLERQARVAKAGTDIQKDLSSKHFDALASRRVQNLFTTVQQTNGLWSNEQIGDKIKAWNSGKEKPKPEEVTSMANLLDQQEFEISRALNKQAREGVYSGGKSFLDIHGAEETNKRIQAQTQYIRDFRAQIRSDKLPAAMMTAQYATDLKNAGFQRMMEQPELKDYVSKRGAFEVAFAQNSPFLAKISEQFTAGQYLGPLNTWMTETTKAAALQRNPYIGDPNKDPVTLAATLRAARDNSVPIATTGAEALKNLRYIVDPNTPDEAKRGFIQYFFDTKNLGVLGNFTKDSVDEYGRPKPGQASIFNSMYSKGIIDEAYRVTRNDPELWGMVKNWGLQAFQEQVGQDLKDLGNTQLPVGAQIVYADESHNFKLMYKGVDITYAQPGANRSIGVTDSAGNTSYYSSEALETSKRAIVRINGQLSNMSNLASKEGENVDGYLMQAMVASGYQPNLGTTTGFSNQMINSIKTLTLRDQLIEQRKLQEDVMTPETVDRAIANAGKKR